VVLKKNTFRKAAVIIKFRREWFGKYGSIANGVKALDKTNKGVGKRQQFPA
jgi:hypothetical protein